MSGCTKNIIIRMERDDGKQMSIRAPYGRCMSSNCVPLSRNQTERLSKWLRDHTAIIVGGEAPYHHHVGMVEMRDGGVWLCWHYVEKRITTGYKVVTRTNTGLWSQTNIGDVVEYKPDEWVDRPYECGPLAVWEKLEDALESCRATNAERLYDLCEVWECEYKPSEDDALWYVCAGEIVATASLPPGTALADKVRLIRPVEE